MPSLNVSIKFNNTNCFKAAQDLAAACGLDYWADGSGFNIGTRDSTVHALGYVGSNSKRALDYVKVVDQVIVYGVDLSGNPISGSAGSPGSLAAFVEKKATSAATLANIAAFKLQVLNNPSNGNSLECLISQVAAWHPGQYVSASRADLDLVGSFIIQRITKSAVVCTVEVDAAMPQMDVNLQRQDDYAGPSGDLANYPTPGATGATGPPGANGTNGNYFEWVFKRAASQPDTPTGNTPSGWSTTPPSPDGNPLWASTAEMTAGGVLVSSWSTPIQMEGASVQTLYSVDGVSDWHSVFTAGDFFMELRVGVSGSWQGPMRIVAENGQIFTASDNIRHAYDNSASQMSLITDAVLLKQTNINEAINGSIRVFVDVYAPNGGLFWIYKNDVQIYASPDITTETILSADVSDIAAGDQIIVYGASDYPMQAIYASDLDLGFDPDTSINVTLVQ